jgi:GntR family transcriptional regulator, transcriptional repressor for pyruvate dehydrogenase complex
MSPQEARLLEPIRRSRIYEHIVEQIQALISDGKLRPGDQLPPERALAETFKVSRTSVREALRALEMSGLVEGRQGGGTFVKTPSAHDLVQPLASVLLAGKQQLADVLEVREVLEPGLACLAAERASDDQIAEMEAILERQAERVRRGETYPDEDTAFHHTIALAAGNPLVLRLVGVVMDLLHEVRAGYLQGGGRPTRSLADHHRILDAIKRRDGEAARQATLEHISQVRERLAE